MRLHLASSSARRVEILRALGLSFSAQGVDIDETPLPGEVARAMVLRLAETKARTAARDVSGLVLGADTVVALQGRIFGKPQSMAEAMNMLASLSGQQHEVLTAVAVISDGRVLSDVSETRVRFREISADEARRYWQSGEPEGKAGGYAIQGLAGLFVESIAGSYTGVVGLPVFETARLLLQAGLVVLPAADTEETGSA